MGRVDGEDSADTIQQIVQQVDGRQFAQLHVWQRQLRRPTAGVPSWLSNQTEDFARSLHEALRSSEALRRAAGINQCAKPGQRVLDVCCVAPSEWWLGWHEVSTFGQRWPAGVPAFSIPDPMVSRAYLKMKEMLLWSEMPIVAGQRCVEIGAAPGGASQALLEAGLSVTGVDPAEMDPLIAKHPSFRHVRKRGADLRRDEYAGYPWLVVDANITPHETLAMVESIVQHRATRIEGLLLTLKIADWQLAEQVKDWVDQARAWGFNYVRCKQLATHHRELCLAAMRSRGLRRAHHKKRSKRRRQAKNRR